MYNRRWDIIFEGPDVPTGHEYIQLPGSRYIFSYNDHSMVVDHVGNIVKRIDTGTVEREYIEERHYPYRSDKYLLKAVKEGMYYYIHPGTLVEYRGT
jgi:hypothetical protein